MDDDARCCRKDDRADEINKYRSKPRVRGRGRNRESDINRQKDGNQSLNENSGFNVLRGGRGAFHKQVGRFSRRNKTCKSGKSGENRENSDVTDEMTVPDPASDQQLDDMNTLEKSMNNLNLRETMIEQLRNGTYPCLICLSNVKPRDEIWSCSGCYHVYHLSCITDWALSNTQQSENRNQVTLELRSSWRCPACQQSHTPKTNPLVYRCFCGKATRPEFRPGSSTIPHGCDEVCGKARLIASTADGCLSKRVLPCPHNCNELCHPGPCPPCVSVMQMHCPCGRVIRISRCGEEPPKPCGAPCDRLLEKGRCAFGTHSCPVLCHDGDCPPCKKLIKSVCYCGRVDEVTFCGSEKARRYDISPGLRSDEIVGELDLCDVEMFFDGNEDEKTALLGTESGLEALFVGTVFSCEQVCQRPLDCGHHSCTALCHPGDCPPCPFLPSQCLTCPCGRVPLSKLVTNGDIYGNRKQCTDPIPVCPNVCGRSNPICGHQCPEKCHAGSNCPPCKLTTQINCRCGKSSKDIPCQEYALAVIKDPNSIQFLCGRVCRKKKSCGRHKCNRKCCDIMIHICQEICGRTLACGKHTCEDLCHCGPCGTCWRGVINEEIYCHCGATFLPPPQPCGTAPPECSQPCTRVHACDHPVTHTCHSDAECPKCTVLMTKRCPGDHTWMFNVPCFQNVITCGRPCDKPLPGCSHRCRRQCHAGDCLTSNEVCTQPCDKPRPDCGHTCGQPCHEVVGIPCSKVLESLKCRVPIALVCACGHRNEEQPCYQLKTLVDNLKKKDPNFLLRCFSSSNLPFGLPSNDVLPCDASCARAKKEADAKATASSEADPAPKMWVRGGAQNMVEGLPPAFPPPEYSDFLKQFATSNLSFAAEVEKALYDLVSETLEMMKASGAKACLNKCVSHRFNPMNRTKRRFIIELAEHYGVDCVELDPSPHRYVEALAVGGRVHFPGGASKHQYVSLAGQIQASFVGSVKVDAEASAPARVAAKPAPLRCAPNNSSNTCLLSFSSVVGRGSTSEDNSGNQIPLPDQ